VLKAECPYLSEVIVHGEHRKYVTALFTLDEEAITGWAEEHGLGGLSYGELAQHERVRDLIDGYVDRANTKLERWETIKRFAILPSDLSVDEGEVTPSMKVRRKTVIERNQDLVESLYDAG